MDIQICKPHSSANLVIKGLIFLEARACFLVHSGIHIYLCESRGQRASNGSVLLRDGILNLATAFLR